MKKGVIYTCVSGNYDSLRDYLVVSKDWDYVCFSNTVKSGVYNRSWKILPLGFSSLDDVRNARWHKINPHKILKKYRFSVWIDANIDVVDKKFYQELDKHVSGNELFATMKHPERNCIYDEAKVIIDEKIDVPEIVEKQVTQLKKLNYPKQNGLIVSSILFRQHNDNKVSKVMEEWWSWVRDFSRRDQLSLNYALWKAHFKPTKLPFKYVPLGQSGSLFWRHHDVGWKLARDRLDHLDAQQRIIDSMENRLADRERVIEKQNDVILQIKGSLSFRVGRAVVAPVKVIKRLLRKQTTRR